MRVCDLIAVLEKHDPQGWVEIWELGEGEYRDLEWETSDCSGHDIPTLRCVKYLRPPAEPVLVPVVKEDEHAAGHS